MGNSFFQTLAIRAVTGAWDQFTGHCPSLWPNYGMCFVSIPKSWLHWSILVALPNSMAENDDNTCLYLLRTKTGLVDLNFLPTCVLHSGTSTCLRVNLTYLCAIWADGYTAQINLKTLSKPMVWSDAYKCCFFFCLLYEMCYFALSLLKHTFKKKTNNVNVYSIWVSFFFLLLSKKIMTCGHFNWDKNKAQ